MTELDNTVRSLMSRASSVYRSADAARKDVVNAVTHYKGLSPKTDKFMFNDGSHKELLCLRGTIPVPYRGDTYNIPIAMWILDTHPMHAPMCYVCPTQDMDIRVSKHVDHTGKIYLPYLHEWNSSNSDIVGLIQICIITFSEQPPVFAKASQQAQQPSAQPSYYQQMHQQQPPPAQQPQSNTNTITSDHIRASLVSAVEDKIRRALHEEFDMKRVEMETLRKMKEDLSGNGNNLRTTLDAMNKELGELGSSQKRLVEKKAELETTNESLEGNEEVDVDELVSVQYPLYNQLVKAYAEDASDEDAIYYLGEALRRGVIDCDTFLKSVRNLSRKQFFVRLTLQRCRAKAKLDY